MKKWWGLGLGLLMAMGLVGAQTGDPAVHTPAPPTTPTGESVLPSESASPDPSHPLGPGEGPDLPSAEAAQVPSCAKCHRQIAEDFQVSAHAERGLNCGTCHGDDPQAEALGNHAQAPPDFRGKPAKDESLQWCSRCHADRQRMRQYGLPTDQYEEYLTSQHGILLAQGDTNVAVCTDCHGTHKILPSSDPESRVHPKNVPSTCAVCHANRELMAPYGIPTDQYERYVNSVHGQAVLERGDTGAATCVSCHGNHGALPPGVTEIGSVCGRCHQNTRKAFVASPHKKAMDAAKMSECVSCHGNHDIADIRDIFDVVQSLPDFEQVSLEEVENHVTRMMPQVCSPCHTESSEAYRRGASLQKLIDEAQTLLYNTGKSIHNAKAQGLAVESLEGDWGEAKTDWRQAAVIQHTLSPKEVEIHVKNLRAMGEEVRDALEVIHGRLQRRKFSLVFIWGFIGWTCVLLYMKWRRAAVEMEEVRHEG